MNEFLDDAKEEMKRADHLIFVSLKYTRTCDVLKHVVERLINCIEYMITALLEDLKEKNQIEELPPAPVPKANLVKQKFEDDELLQEMINFFLLLRKLNREDFARSCEFRRHVTMTIHMDDEEYQVNIDVTTEWFKKLKEYYAYIYKILNPDEEELP